MNTNQVINQILTEKQKNAINKAIATLTPIYEKAVNNVPQSFLCFFSDIAHTKC